MTRFRLNARQPRISRVHTHPLSLFFFFFFSGSTWCRCFMPVMRGTPEGRGTRARQVVWRRVVGVRRLGTVLGNRPCDRDWTCTLWCHSKQRATSSRCPDPSPRKVRSEIHDM
ncbi:hypothetical protein F5X97DRAFT_91399 [Nemania serpens]|nr:hypothetical protein F5X97DRAFT_91399 [Nemania serpens]